jgi:hypothetical protein
MAPYFILPSIQSGSINRLEHQGTQSRQTTTVNHIRGQDNKGDPMANEYQPRIGDWYQDISGENFEIVAIDDDEATLEIQYFDGAVEEIDTDSWYEMDVEPIEPPEDWSGSLDIEREDYGVDLELNSHNDHNNPLDEFE